MVVYVGDVCGLLEVASLDEGLFVRIPRALGKQDREAQATWTENPKAKVEKCVRWWGGARRGPGAV